MIGTDKDSGGQGGGPGRGVAEEVSYLFYRGGRGNGGTGHYREGRKRAAAEAR